MVRAVRAGKKIYFLAGLTALFTALLVVWLLVVSPRATDLPKDFSYSAEIISVDNFYDENQKRFTGPIESDTTFSYDTVSTDNGNLTIRNRFSVRSKEGEKIFSVERFYGIDPKTHKHVKSSGDRKRQGYLFAPLDAGKEPFTYWHVNYDTPAQMVYQGETEIDGLKVNRYRSNLEADQTENLGHLPGVPDKRRVVLDVRLDTWIEPKTGRLIKYADNTTAYYIDRRSGKRIAPWNKFSNRFTQESITDQVKTAKTELRRVWVKQQMIPGLLLLITVISAVLLATKLIRNPRE